jgi:uncharacterized protein YhaN
MKILRLDLRAFGRFSNVVLDLSAGHEGLHVVHGPNEAGKSTALRAIENALFGIPTQTGDAFLHSYQNLRVGVTLANRHGDTLTFVRRKGNTNTLLDADGLTPLADNLLLPFLGGVDRERFQAMFGIGHEQLVAGGRELVRGGGNLGQVLFAAGTGIADLQAIQDRLRAEAEELFKPRASTKRINKTLKSLDEARRRARHPRVSSDEWAQHDEILRAALARRDAVQNEWQQLQTELHRLQRLAQAQPLVGRRRQVLDGQTRLGPVRRLPADMADQRRAAEAALEVARKTQQTAEDELVRLDAELGRLPLPDLLLAREMPIRGLSDLLGSHRKAQRDLPGLLARREQVEQAATAVLRRLRPALSLAEAEQLRLTRLQQVAIQDLGNRHDALVQALAQAQSDREETARLLAEQRAAWESLAAPRDAGPLKQALRQAQSEGDLDQALAEAEARARRLEEQAAVGLARLGLWSGTLEQLERLAVPSAETVDRFDKELADVDRRVALAEAKLRQVHDARAEIERQIAETRSQGHVPSEEDLAAARRLRDQGWQLVVAAWQGPAASAERLAGFLAQFPDRELAAAYAEAVRVADELSDRLRREADRVASLASLTARAVGLDRQAEVATGELASLVAERDLLESHWRACWRPAGMVPGRPREMRAWLAAWRALADAAEAIRRERHEAERIAQRIDAHRTRLADVLAELQEPVAADATLASRLARAASLVEQIETAAVRREELEKSIRQLHQRQAAAEARARQADAELAQWRNRWGIAVEPLGLTADATPAVANAVLAQIQELFTLLADAHDKAERIEGIYRDAQAFAASVEQLTADVAPDLAGAAAEVAAEALLRRLDEAVIAGRQRQTLEADRRRRSVEKEKALATIDQMTARLNALCREAGCRRADELPQAEHASAEAARLDQALAEIDDQLAALTAGATIEQFIDEAQRVSSDELPAQLADLQRQVDELDNQRTGLNEQIGRQREALAQMQGESDAAAAAEEVQELLARLEQEAAEYVRIRLALRLLGEGMEHYRQQNEGPVLRRAAELFCQFTLGRFAGLRVDEENGRQVLRGVRANEEPKLLELAAMSDGTADQLYLALRLASLESYLDGREPLPLVVDDVLIRFDDQRASAALRALAELARKTQVIFFTHHRHLVELARAHVAAGELFVYELGS